MLFFLPTRSHHRAHTFPQKVTYVFMLSPKTNSSLFSPPFLGDPILPHSKATVCRPHISRSRTTLTYSTTYIDISTLFTIPTAPTAATMAAAAAASPRGLSTSAPSSGRPSPRLLLLLLPCCRRRSSPPLPRRPRILVRASPWVRRRRRRPTLPCRTRASTRTYCTQASTSIWRRRRRRRPPRPPWLLGRPVPPRRSQHLLLRRHRPSTQCCSTPTWPSTPSWPPPPTRPTSTRWPRPEAAAARRPPLRTSCGATPPPPLLAAAIIASRPTTPRLRHAGVPLGLPLPEEEAVPPFTRSPRRAPWRLRRRRPPPAPGCRQRRPRSRARTRPRPGGSRRRAAARSGGWRSW